MIKTPSACSKSSEIDKAYDRYMVDWCLISQVFSCNFAFIFNLWTARTWRYSILSFMIIENCWKLKLLKFLQVLLTVSVIFSDAFSEIFCFVVYCFNQHLEQCVSLSEKSKDTNLMENTDVTVRTEW